MLWSGSGADRPLPAVEDADETFIPKFSECHFFGKQPCALFGFSKPKAVYRYQQTNIS